MLSFGATKVVGTTVRLRLTMGTDTTFVESEANEEVGNGLEEEEVEEKESTDRAACGLPKPVVVTPTELEGKELEEEEEEEADWAERSLARKFWVPVASGPPIPKGSEESDPKGTGAEDAASTASVSSPSFSSATLSPSSCKISFVSSMSARIALIFATPVSTSACTSDGDGKIEEKKLSC